MREVIDGLFVGGKESPELMDESEELSIVHVCDDAAFTNIARSEGNTDKNTKFVKTTSKLILKLTNDESPNAYEIGLFKEALAFIDAKLAIEHNILLYGDSGKSRAPSIAMIYIASKGLIAKDSYEKAEAVFKKKHYEKYEPASGLGEFIKANWTELVG